MPNDSIQITDVIYNAATQCFEALVTVREDATERKYACAINGPITMTFQDAAHGLRKQAMRRHSQAGAGIFSEILRHMPQQRAGRRGFDTRGWLASLVRSDNSHAA